ncbi:MAG TPA: OmpH family outer membrane protein [Chitinophagaceae bacterium]|nr:OmpH family outer membrane protein [Chitinophagaceae bacterium]
MKNGMLIWNVILSLLVGVLLIMQFSSKTKKSKVAISSNDSLVNTGQFRMAYFEMDSVAANFELVKEVKTELAKKEDDINREMENLARNYQQKYKYYQDQAQAGSLTQAQLDAAGVEMKKLDDGMKTRKGQLDQEYNDLMVRRQNDIKTKIETFLKEYNKAKNYSYIISYEQGLFYLKDTAYNITPDVVKGLNQLYKK